MTTGKPKGRKATPLTAHEQFVEYGEPVTRTLALLTEALGPDAPTFRIVSEADGTRVAKPVELILDLPKTDDGWRELVIPLSGELFTRKAAR